MKVMFVVERMEVGGAQRQIAYMANHLSRRNIEVSLLVVKKKGEMIDKIVPEVEIVSCFRLASRMPFLGVIFQVLAIIRAARSKRPNVIYCRLMEFPGAVAGKILGIPTVVAEINNPRKSLETKYKFLQLKKFYRMYAGEIARKLAVLVVANSSRLARESKRFFKLNSKPFFIYNGIDIEQIEKESCETLNHKWILNKETPLIVSVGRLVPSKDFFSLLEAIAILNQTTKARLLIVGGGKLKKQLQKKIGSLNLGEIVSLVGNKANPYPFMKEADVYVSSSIYEGFSNSLIEALALGLPIVSTDHDFGADEMIEDGVSGILVPTADPEAMAGGLERVLKDRKYAETLSRNARKRAQNFTIEKMVSGYEKLFREVAKI